MQLNTPDPDAVQVLDFDFVFIGKIPAGVTLWTTKGDTWKRTVDGWLFTMPRLKATQEVLKAHVLSVTITEGRRVYMDPEEAKKRLRVKREAEKEAREAKRTPNTNGWRMPSE